MKDLISIIVPIYNADKTLARCINALLGQTYHNIEIILVDDGSIDGSLAICQQYAKNDSRIKVIYKENGGVSSARNMGLDVAKGDFIMFCDSDDWAEPDWCEELVSHYMPDNLVMCGHYVEGNQAFLPHEVAASDDIQRVARHNFYQLKLCNFNAPWNKIYKHSVIESNRLRFECLLTNGEDFLFNLRYLNCISGNIVLLGKCVFHYNWPTGGSLSSNVPDNYFSQCETLYHAAKKELDLLCLTGEVNVKQFYTDCFNEYQRGILSVFRSRKTSLAAKITLGNSVMASEPYQTCAQYAVISPNKIYCKLCRLKKCYGLLTWFLLRGKEYL